MNQCIYLYNINICLLLIGRLTYSYYHCVRWEILLYIRSCWPKEVTLISGVAQEVKNERGPRENLQRWKRLPVAWAIVTRWAVYQPHERVLIFFLNQTFCTWRLFCPYQYCNLFIVAIKWNQLIVSSCSFLSYSPVITF